MRCTHYLETAEGGACQDTKRNQQSKAHSLSGDGREGDFVRTQKKTDRARHTHSLETAEGGTCQDTGRKDRARATHSLDTAEGGTCQDIERHRPNKVYSLSGYGRGRDLS